MEVVTKESSVNVHQRRNGRRAADGLERDHAVDAQVSPRGALELLSQKEVEILCARSEPGLLDTFRNCALAVLNTGSESDDAIALFEAYRDFDIEIVQRTRGLKLKVRNAPASAFVDGHMIEGVREHLFSLLRDLVYIRTEIEASDRFDLASSQGVTDAVFHILKQARVLVPDVRPNLVVCWGGHSISRVEYEYTKEVGYHLGLRGLDICTGCGPGAMKGPMKGAAIGHAKQRSSGVRYIGLTEPGIIAAEPPNPMVNHLVVLPDIEKRLEAFVRLGHGIVVFPGGVGTTEELLYLLGLLLHPENESQLFPIVLTGPAASADYFRALDDFIGLTLGERARKLYEIVIGDAQHAAARIGRRVRRVQGQRRNSGDAYYFNWLLRVPFCYQAPFQVDHASVASLALSSDLPTHDLACNLRRMFSAIVTGNVKEYGRRLIAARGPFEIRGEAPLMAAVEALLGSFIAQGRMKLPGAHYEPCYRVVAG
jgi:predicted Rossmann-fold nucleotide-binding protein